MWPRKRVSVRPLLSPPRVVADARVAAMVLLNNDFSSIVVAIEMGRLVFDNLKKVMIYLMPVRHRLQFP